MEVKKRDLEMKANDKGIGKGKMKIAQRVIFLFNGGDGVSTAIAGGLHPNPSSNFQILNESFELSLECYGIKDQNVSGKILHFVNDSGLYEVSILLLQNYKPPIIACALNEVLLKLAGDDLSTMPTLIAPFVIPESKLKHEKKYLVANNKASSVYGIKLGPTTDVTQGLSSKLQKSPPSLQVYNEELALFLHLATLMKFPTIVLIGQSGQHISNKTSKEELQVIHAIGEHLASSLSINFSKEKIAQNPIKISRDNEEAWRALYG